MKLTLKRIAKRPTYTIGRLYVDGVKFCDTLEDTDRGLTSTMSLQDIKKIKIASKTAIPSGTYTVTMNVISPRLSKKEFYRKNCDGGRVPRLLNVPGYEGVLIHVGNTAKDSAGCILVGVNSKVGAVLESKKTFLKLYTLLKKANLEG
jgi:hypothetical protein